jgi:hypothetical protein
MRRFCWKVIRPRTKDDRQLKKSWGFSADVYNGLKPTTALFSPFLRLGIWVNGMTVPFESKGQII